MSGIAFSRRTILAGCATAPFAGSALASPAPAGRGAMIDAHLHFFTNDFDHYPIDTRNAREPADVMRARILRAPVTPSAMLPVWDKLGISAGLGVQYSGAYKTDNSYVLDVADAHPRRIGTEIILSSADPESPALLERLGGTRHVSSIRLTGFAAEDGDLPWLKTPVAERLFAIAQERHLPVGITYLRPVPQARAIATVRGLAERYPRGVIVLEHLGWTGGASSDEGLLPAHRTLADYRNIHFKWTTLNVDALSAAGIAPANFLRAAVDCFGADRLMWGSDFGNTTRPYPGIVADAHDATRLLTRAEAKAVLGGAAHTLYRL